MVVLHGFTYVYTDDLGSWAAIRTRLYLDSGLLTPADLAGDGLYHDAYENHSEHYFVEAHAGLRVGTFRLIDARRGPLQVADQFGFVPDPHGFEISGFAVADAYRSSGAALGVYHTCYRLALERQFSVAYMEVEDWLLDSLLEMGFPVRRLGEPRWTFNAPNHALAIPISEVVPSLCAADSARGGRTRFGELFADPVRGTFDPRTAYSSRRAFDQEDLPA